MGSDTLLNLQKSLKYNFTDSSLLQTALSHKSYVNERSDLPSGDNERLEFLGDAVLDLIVSVRMFNRFPGLDEGEMTRVRAEVVSEKNLASVARLIGLGQYLLLGKGELMTGGHDKDSLLADALEAVIGAIFLDGGDVVVDEVVMGLLGKQIDLAVECKRGLDYKTRLQELVQSRYGIVPQYLIMDITGPDHGRTYLVEVSFADQLIGPGSGKTKKKAEQDAARLALKALGE